MHVIMQMPKCSDIIVERADFSLIILRLLSTGTMKFFYFFFYFVIMIIIYVYIFSF